MASTEMGRMISTLFDGKEEITEEEARTFFVKCMIVAPRRKRKGDGGDAVVKREILFL